jgi:hypothetical protein
MIVPFGKPGCLLPGGFSVNKLLRVVVLVVISAPAFAVTWQQPTAEELSMSVQPEVPGADAVVLYREETTDDREESASGLDAYGSDAKLNFHTLYERIKILTEAGKRYADVRIEYPGQLFSIAEVQGRTIHKDGSVTPFTGKPYQKEIQKLNKIAINETVFTMPDVQVGSILEYRYVLRYDAMRASPPQWYIQRELFLRTANYRFRPSGHDLIDSHGAIFHGASYTTVLPKGAQVKYISSQNAYELVVHNISPIPDEELMPPVHSLSYRVLFYYTAADSPGEFWKTEGGYWSKESNRFASAPKLRDAVSKIVSPSDSEPQKIAKIYDAVMQLENTSFTRGHSQAENKAAGLKVKTADDIWEQKRGNADEITLLFIGLVRAAGMKAYAMVVTDRDTDLFQVNYLTTYQLKDYVAIAQVDGKEQYFDPGERYCAMGELHWKHTSTGGLRQTDNGTAIAETPGAPYPKAQTSRTAQLQLDPDGKVHGFIRIMMTGVPALYWRQRALLNDDAEVNKEFEDHLRETLPPGIDVKTNHFLGLAEWKSLLMVQVDVSGSMGTATSKRVFLPSSFFEASSKPLLVHDKRESQVYLQYASGTQDTVTIELPKTFSPESIPKDAKVPFPNNAVYTAKYGMKDNTYSLSRVLIIANFLFAPSDYGNLKDFFQKVNTQDQQQTILKVSEAVSGQ